MLPKDIKISTGQTLGKLKETVRVAQVANNKLVFKTGCTNRKLTMKGSSKIVGHPSDVSRLKYILDNARI